MKKKKKNKNKIKNIKKNNKSKSKTHIIYTTQPSIPPGLVNEYQLWLGRQRQVWFILLADERGVCR